ncbi:MAG: hypothetical protein HN548_04305 [Opitutae bacterium]|jgi:hypothetical protein|nr:hypothetical protein [Opitutae bacterium]
MKLPLIKHLGKFIEDHDEDFILETIEVVEHITEFEGLKDEELDVLGECLSNLYGALEVQKAVKEEGISPKDALNGFMKRVQGSIDS